MIRIPSISALCAFEAAARHENFRLAAEELHVTHGAVAQQIRGLEAELGVSLFKRQPRGVRLTTKGNEYLTSVQDALGLLTRATRDLRPGGRKNRISLSVTPSFASCWLVSRIGGFALAHPEIDLRLAASELKVDLREGEADLAVRQGEPPFGENLAYVQLLPGDSAIVGAAKVMADIHNPVDLLSVPLLHDGHARWPGYFESRLGSVPNGADSGLRFNQTAMSIKLAAEGKGVALVPRALVAEELNSGTLAEFDGPVPDAGAGFFLIWEKARARDPVLIKVRDWIQNLAALTLPE